MKLSNIKLALSGEIPMDILRLEINDEISEYSKNANIIGSSMPVYLNEDIELKFCENNLKALCEAFLNENLTELEINYIVDALQMANRVSFESEDLFDRISYLTDPAINGHLTKEIVLELMK